MELSKIEMMFRSNDKDYVRLAQKCCHDLRISYYVFTGYKCIYDAKCKMTITGQWLPRYKRVTLFYSLYSSLDSFYTSYKIDLSGKRKKKNKKKA